MTVPAVVRYAGYLVAVQGIAGLVVAVVYLGHTLTGANQDQVRGLALGAWYLRGSGQLLYAALVAVLCLVVLGFLFSPAAVQWVTRSRDELS